MNWRMPDKEDIVNMEFKSEIPHPNFCRVCNKENCKRGIHSPIKEENNMKCKCGNESNGNFCPECYRDLPNKSEKRREISKVRSEEENRDSMHNINLINRAKAHR